MINTIIIIMITYTHHIIILPYYIHYIIIDSVSVSIISIVITIGHVHHRLISLCLPAGCSARGLAEGAPALLHRAELRPLRLGGRRRPAENTTTTTTTTTTTKQNN